MQTDYHNEQEEEIHLSDYWRILKRHKWISIAVFVVIVTTVTIASIMMTPVYRSTATLFIDQETSNVLTISENNLALGAQNYATYKEYFQSQKEIIKSRGIIEQVFREFKLDQIDKSSVNNASIKDFIRDFLGKSKSAGTAPTGTKEYANIGGLVDQFRDTIKVAEIRNTRLLKLSVENTDPVLASNITNRIAQIFIERNLAYISKSEILDLHKNEYLKLQAQLSENSKIYKRKHPKTIRLKEKLAEVTRKIKQERDENLPGAKQLISTSDLTGLKANNISVQDWAEPAYKPVKPNKRKNVLLSIIVGIFSAVGLAFFLEYCDHSVKSIEDVGRGNDWPFLGYIPEMIPRNGEMLEFWVNSKPKSAISEAYRTIRTSLLFSSTDEQPLKSILLTSPGQQEGKTTMINNLAIAMAQNNNKVLLIDADMRKPRLHRIYNTDNKKGLSAYLSGQTSFEEIVHTTDIENLSFIGCGPHPPNPSELLASRKMEQFITYAKKHFDCIFFDSPPALMVTDAVILSKIVDGTVIILESGKTTKKVVPVLRKRLESAQSRVVGLVINKIKPQNGEYNYYAGYYGDAEDQDS